MSDAFDNSSHQFIHLKIETYLYNYYEKTIYPPETLHPTPYREHPGGRFHHRILSQFSAVPFTSTGPVSSP
jgi:hypothetical protein